MALLVHGAHIDSEVASAAHASDTPQQLAPGEITLRFPYWSGVRRYDRRAQAAAQECRRSTLIARFQIPRPDVLSGGDADALWERVRRFMESDGRHVRNLNHPLASPESPTSWWESMGKVGPFGSPCKRWRTAPMSGEMCESGAA